MSYLSTALTRIAERYDLKQAEIARQTGLTKSHVSRVFNGEQVSITDEDLVKLLKLFTRDRRDRSEIIAARCMDVRVGPGAEGVEILVKEAAAGDKQKPEFPDVELSHEMERVFAWLRSQCPVNPDVQKHLLTFARVTGME